MISRIVLTIALALALAPAFATYSAPTGGNCDEWSAEIGDPRDSYRMRQLGCWDPAGDAVYISRANICNQIARQAARAGLRGNDARLYVEAKWPTCYWDVEQRNYGIASTTQ